MIDPASQAQLKEAIASVLNLAVHEVGPPLQHFAPLGEMLRAVVDAPHSLSLVGEGLFDPIGNKL